MSQSKKSVRLRSPEERRQAPKTKRVAKSGDAERLAIRQVLARHDISPASKKAIENLAIKYAPLMKRLADR